MIPDDDVGNTIVEVFGFRSYVMTQYRRMMYWVPKLRYVNPWPVVEKLPDDIEGEDAVRLAQLAAARICPDPNTEFTTITNVCDTFSTARKYQRFFSVSRAN